MNFQQHQMPRAVIFGDNPGWHGETLVKALAERGLDSTFVSLADCCLDFSAGRPTVFIPGFDELPPNAAFVRGVAGGTLEEVVFRLNILHALDLIGIPVFNTGRAIERTVDKAMTTFLLLQRGIPTPRTWVCESDAYARSVALRQFKQAQSLVIKPVFGSQGEGVVRVSNLDELETHKPSTGVYYLQEYLDRMGDPYCDWRVLVVEGKTALAMQRQSKHWVTNRAQGADCTAIQPDRTMRALAEAAADAVDIDYAGVDLLRDRKGNWLVGEVNSIPAWQGLQNASGVDVSGLLCDAFVRKIRLTEPAAVSA